MKDILHTESVCFIFEFWSLVQKKQLKQLGLLNPYSAELLKIY